jgi:N-acetylglucosaminyldiphosphoundecaprenol N-acetyl-beta-D-mannosaminyltransferase
MNILGVRIDNLEKYEILGRVEGFLDEPKFHQIATIGPEFILEAQNNPGFKEILNSCDLNVADGFGIRCAFWRHGKHLKARMTGVRLMMEILRIAEKNNFSVFLAARSDGLSTWKETRDAILKIYPKLDVSGENIDIKNFVIASNSRSLAIARDGENDFKIVFANFGAPYQELFLNSQKSGKIRLAMGVGGSFDFLTGRIRRAPVFLRWMGFEWMWRLIQQPKRWRRIFRAVVMFSIKVIFDNK